MLTILYLPISVLLSYNEYLVNELDNLGVSVYVDRPSNLLGDLMYIYEKFKGRIRGRFLPTYLMPEGLRNAYLMRLIKQRRFDVIHMNSLSLSKDALKEAKRLGIPVLYVLHTAPISEEIYRWLDEYVDLYVAPSNFTLANEKGKFKKQAIVIHHGIDTEEFKSHPKEEARSKMKLPLHRKVILWNDRISPEKDLKTFLEAIPLILKECRDCYFYIKGRGVVKKYWHEIKPLVNELKERYRSYIKLHIGWVKQDMLPYIYSAADVFVRTSLHENFGLAFIEAMACGVPVVAANAATAPEVIGDAGLLYKPHDSFDLADKVIALLNDEYIREELSRKCRERVKFFTAKRMAQQYLQAYHSLCKD
ncbi:MAG: glycosyltransferase family 4 protein [Candidatus Korarchaeota archaeon]